MLNISELPTKMYDLGLKKTESLLAELENGENKSLIQEVRAINFSLKIKHKTHQKCVYQILFMVVASIILNYIAPDFHFHYIIFSFLFISSFGGIWTNRLSKKEKKYLKS